MNFKMIRHKFSIYDSEHQLIYTVSQKKTSHFNFWYNFVICWDILAPCSGLIAGWCNLLHTHHWCKAFTWRDVTHDLIQADTGFRTTWLMGHGVAYVKVMSEG